MFTGTYSTSEQEDEDSDDGYDGGNERPSLGSILDEEDENSPFNLWDEYGLTTDKDTDYVKKERGNRTNAHTCPNLIKKLLRDLKLFPIWGNVHSEQFGIDDGNLGTSGGSEGEFNKTKNILNRKTRKRPDEFVAMHLNYLEGNIKLIDASLLDEAMDANSRGVRKGQQVSTSKSSGLSTSGTGCTLCADGNSPSDYHKCVTCGRNIHALVPCSYPEGDEDDIRICHQCHYRNEKVDRKANRTRTKPASQSHNKLQCIQEEYTGSSKASYHNYNVNKPIENQSKASSDNLDVTQPFEEPPTACSENFNDSQPIEDADFSPDRNCSLCFRGHDPLGPDSCISCGKLVHVTEPCSFLNKDGRVCYVCFKSKSVNIVLSTRPYENWRNKGGEKKSKGFYLGNNQEKVKAAINFKDADLPTLENGSLSGAVRLDGKNITLTNTCAFDAFYHVLFVNAFDNDVFKQMVKTYHVTQLRILFYLSKIL